MQIYEKISKCANPFLLYLEFATFFDESVGRYSKEDWVFTNPPCHELRFVMYFIR